MIRRPNRRWQPMWARYAAFASSPFMTLFTLGCSALWLGSAVLAANAGQSFVLELLIAAGFAYSGLCRLYVRGRRRKSCRRDQGSPNPATPAVHGTAAYRCQVGNDNVIFSGMETSEPSGSLDDAGNVQRTAAAPWWGRALTVVVIAAVSAITYGGPLTVATAVVVIVVLAAMLVAGLGWQRHRGVPMRGLLLGHGGPSRSRANSRLVLIGMLVGWVIVAQVLKAFLTPGTVASYGAQFLCAAIIFGVGTTLLARSAPDAGEPRP
jgi:hypothetical protein